MAFILYTRDKKKTRESRGGERVFTMTLLSMLQDTGQGTVNGRLHAEGRAGYPEGQRQPEKVTPVPDPGQA